MRGKILTQIIFPFLSHLPYFLLAFHVLSIKDPFMNILLISLKLTAIFFAGWLKYQFWPWLKKKKKRTLKEQKEKFPTNNMYTVFILILFITVVNFWVFPLSINDCFLVQCENKAQELLDLVQVLQNYKYYSSMLLEKPFGYSNTTH